MTEQELASGLFFTEKEAAAFAIDVSGSAALEYVLDGGNMDLYNLHCFLHSADLVAQFKAFHGDDAVPLAGHTLWKTKVAVTTATVLQLDGAVAAQLAAADAEVAAAADADLYGKLWIRQHEAEKFAGVFELKAGATPVETMVQAHNVMRLPDPTLAFRVAGTGTN
jgi:hypothetical protein